MHLEQLYSLKSNIDNYKINESSKYLDEFEKNISKAIYLSLDVIIKKIISTSNPEVLDQFYTDINKLKNTYQNIIDNITATLGDSTSLDELSSDFINYLELDRDEDVLFISQTAFIKLDSAERIFKMATILVLCYFAKHKIVRTAIKEHFEIKKPEDQKEAEPVAKQKAMPIEKKSAVSKKIIVAMLALFFVGLSIYFLSDSKQGKTNTELTADTETQSQNIDFKDINKLGDYIDYLLPSDEIITIPEKGSEKALLDLILDSSNNLDNSSYWLVLDRVHFIGRDEFYFIDSEEQIKSIALILASFPKIKIKIAGYTDNLGNPKSNKDLSLKRANSIKEALIKLKISENRITTEGYGKEFALANNDTEENRKQNRRISIKIVD